MSRNLQWVIALLVCSMGVIAILLTETVWSWLLAIAGLVFLLRHVIQWLKEVGRRTDPNYDKIYADQERKWQFYIMTILGFSLIVYLFPVSDWEFWLCMAGWILNTVLTFLTFRGLAKRTEESMSCSPENVGESQSQTAKDHPR